MGSVLSRQWRYLLLGAVLIAVVLYFFFGRNGGLGSTIVIAKGDFAREVQVSGTVIPARSVDLGFAASGRIAGTYATVGQRVVQGQILAETENGDLIAAVEQKQAALTENQAELSALKAGTRTEEVAVAEADVENAKAALVKSLRSAYTSADDAVRNRADQLFTNPRINPALELSGSGTALKTKLESERKRLEETFSAWEILLTRVTADTAEAEARIVETYLIEVANFLTDANSAVNQAVPSGTITAAVLDSYETSLATARTNVNTAANSVSDDIGDLDSAEKTLALKKAGSTAEDIAAQEAAILGVAADVRSAQAALAKTRVIAPFPGVVTRMDAKRGQIASPSTSEISMQTDALFQIETFIPEVAIANVHTGDAATTTLDAYGGNIFFEAKVISIDPAETIKEGVPTYKTTLAFLSPDPRIRSGMTADVDITTGMLTGAIVIPSGAVARTPSGSYVTVVSGKNTANVPVELGSSPALGQVEIISGLSAGDVILTKPASP